MTASLQLLPPDEIGEAQVPSIEEGNSESTVGAGARLTDFPSIPWEQWKDRQSEIDKGHLVVVVVGRCTYDDVFGKQRQTDFSRFHQNGHPTDFFRTARTGNSAT
jgi:hypothetical protein